MTDAPGRADGVSATVARRLAEIRGPDADAEPLVRRLVESFLTHAPAQLDRLAEDLERGDLAAVSGTSHRLQGSAANLGADSLAARCANLEAAARAGRIDLAGDQLPRVRAAHAELEPVLRGLAAGSAQERPG
jgi:HPt (histidine-containing phosphotransfer) domain-containing protein